MDNGNKHGPRLDEQLHHEVESLTRGAPVEARAEPEREQQGAADDEPAPDALIHRHETSRDGALTHDEVELRSDLARHLRLSDFPARPARLLELLTERSAPESLIERLRQVPDWEYETVEAVWEAMGGNRERRF
ncbi:MAG: hypothetical protein JWO37_1036 [Acidimicrobiales bacterium]|jgi:hypothetical protein|nr:hypothetical protein [Acidimicrobiales bacterium]